jgi:hypothetical protein
LHTVSCASKGQSHEELATADTISVSGLN